MNSSLKTHKALTSSLSMGIHLGDDDRSNIDLVCKSTRLGLTSLTNGGIHNEHNIIWALK